MTKILSKEQLLSGELLKRELYKIPGTDNAVWMRELSADHMLQFKRIVDSFQAEGVKKTTAEQDAEIMAAVISFSVCDENGALWFDSPEEAKGLANNNFNVLMDLGNKALEISNIKEVAANLKNDQTKSLSASSPRSSRKRARKS